jgi:hypothetical protein
MLFIQLLFLLGALLRRRARMGYADNIALLSAGASLESNTLALQEDFKLLNSWAASEGLIFNMAKSELVHFSCRKCSNNPSIKLDMGAETHLIKAILLDGAV